MNHEELLVEKSMDTFFSLRKHPGSALSEYLKILPDSTLKGMAQHLLRLHFKQSGRKAESLNELEKNELIARVCQQILNELILKARKRNCSKGDEDRDGAELFYRRALNHISRDSYADAERLLKQAVEISPDFTDGWEVLAEVLEYNGKAEGSQQARLKLRQLRGEL